MASKLNSKHMDPTGEAHKLRNDFILCFSELLNLEKRKNVEKSRGCGHGPCHFNMFYSKRDMRDALLSGLVQNEREWKNVTLHQHMKSGLKDRFNKTIIFCQDFQKKLKVSPRLQRQSQNFFKMSSINPQKNNIGST